MCRERMGRVYFDAIANRKTLCYFCLMGELIALLIFVVVIAVVAAVIVYAVDMLPVDAGFKSIIRILVVLIAALSILYRALPLLGVSI